MVFIKKHEEKRNVPNQKGEGGLKLKRKRRKLFSDKFIWHEGEFQVEKGGIRGKRQRAQPKKKERR